MSPKWIRHYEICTQRASRTRPECSPPTTCTESIGKSSAIRCRLGIDRWLLFGGSWGSTLALAYAIKHPERALGLIVRGIFLFTEHEFTWGYKAVSGANAMFPDEFEQFLAPLTESQRENPIEAYQDLIYGDDDAIRENAIRAWSTWEAVRA